MAFAFGSGEGAEVTTQESIAEKGSMRYIDAQGRKNTEHVRFIPQ
jgi:hypothetical protein